MVLTGSRAKQGFENIFPSWKGGYVRSFGLISRAAVSPAICALPATVRALRCCRNVWPMWRNCTPSTCSWLVAPWKASTMMTAPRSRDPSCLSLRLYRHLEPPRRQPSRNYQFYISALTVGHAESFGAPHDFNRVFHICSHEWIWSKSLSISHATPSNYSAWPYSLCFFRSVFTCSVSFYFTEYKWKQISF